MSLEILFILTQYFYPPRRPSVAKKWFSIKLSGGVRGAEALNRALERALLFINQHNLGAEEFKITFFDETLTRDNGYLVWAIVFYLAETELKYTEET